MRSRTYETTNPAERTSAQSSYYYKELDLKNQQLDDMRKRLNNLLDEKQNCQNEIQNLKAKNYSINAKCEQESQMSTLASKTKEYELLSVIQKLQNENEFLRNRLNKKEETESNFEKTIAYKLHNAKREIDNLSVMNTFKDNVLERMQNFYNKINKMLPSPLNIELDFANDDMNSYGRKMKEIEERVLGQMQYDTFHNGTNYFRTVNTDGVNNISNQVNTNEQEPQIQNTNSTPKQLQAPKMNMTSYKSSIKSKVNPPFQPSELKCNKRFCNCSYNGVKPQIIEHHNRQNKNKSSNFSITRTPPRDDDYVSPNSKKMKYLRSINSPTGHSRKKVINY